MQLKLKRSQREGGLVTKAVIFCLDARIDLTREEQYNVNYYKLASQVIYNSDASKRHLERANAENDGSMTGALKSLASTAMAALKLNITINGLQSGQHVECKTMEELLGAEEAIMTACHTLKNYLDTAATFDGRETLIDFSTGVPAVEVGAVPQAAIAALTSPTAGIAPPAVHASALPSETRASTMPFAAATASMDAYEDHSSSTPLGLDETWAKVEEMWQQATMGQRILLGGLGFFVFFLIFHAL